MPESQPGLARLLTDLRRRKVFRVVLAYLAVGWVLIEVTDTVGPALNLPEWTLSLVTILVLLGLPVAIVLSWAYDVTPAGLQRTPSRASPRTPSSASRAWTIAAVGGILVLALAGGAFVLTGDEEAPAFLAPDLIAVVPFRVNGGPELAYLREGMVDALAVTWTGVAGPRAVDPASVFARLEGRGAAALPMDSALAVAASLGAGEVLSGSVVGNQERLTLHASRNRTADGAVLASTRVSGPADSLPWLVDRLTAELLTLGAGETLERIPALADHPLESLREFLEGQAAFRNSRFTAAHAHFRRALDLDSTFALAAIQYRRALGWNSHADAGPERLRAQRLAWRHRDRLGPVDRAMLRASQGPRYPAPSTVASRLAEWERLLAQAPDRADAWFQYGDLIFHFGDFAGREDGIREARRAFARALEADSGYVLALMHLLDASAYLGDGPSAERYGAVWLARDTSRDVRSYVRVLQDYGDGVDTALTSLIARGELPEDMEFFVPYALATWAVSPASEPVFRAHIEGRIAASPAPAQRRELLWSLWAAALNRGRPRAGDSVLTRLADEGEDPLRLARERVRAALYWSAPVETGAAGAAELDPVADAVLSGEHADPEELVTLCTAAQWNLARGDRDIARAAHRVLAANADQQTVVGQWLQTCALMLDAWLAVGSSEAGTPALLRLDSVLAPGPTPTGRHGTQANLLLARLARESGRTDLAARAARRVSYGLEMQYYLSTVFHEQGHLAAAAGDEPRAVDRLRRYLWLREAPEPALVSEAESARRLLASLVEEDR